MPFASNLERRLSGVWACLAGGTLLSISAALVARPIVAVKQRLDGIRSSRVVFDAPPLPALLDSDARPR